MSKKIGVLGCGWLGLPLAVSLIEKGYHVKGTTTSSSKLKDLSDKGIVPFLVDLKPDQIEGAIDEFLTALDILIINVPPGMRRGGGESYAAKMKLLAKEIKDASVNHIVFVSSTSVYGNAEGEIDETAERKPVTDSGKELVASEDIFTKEFQTAILRFGGLIGPDRHPVRFLSGRSGLKNGHDAVNLIHQNDCIHMIQTIIEREWWNEIFNGVYPDHPAKSDYYREEALKRGLQPPEYSDQEGSSTGKIVKSRNFLIKNQQFFTPIRS